ncbi:MAG: caspase family protein [Candidatus Heimdallarchaeaceae archaeon]
MKKNYFFLLLTLLLITATYISTISTLAFGNWVEWEGHVYKDDGSGVYHAKVRLMRGSTTLETTYTNIKGYYYIKHYVDTTDYLKIKASKANYTSASQHVLSRSLGEPEECNLNITYVTTWAVIVGVENYMVSENYSQALYTENDAEDWYNHLSNPDGLDFDHIEVYEDSATEWNGRAEEKNVKDALNNMVSNADGGDIIVFVFSGHGTNTSVNGHYSLCMWDADDGRNGEDGYLYDTELASILESSKAERIFLFFDSCYSGGMQGALNNLDNKNSIFLTAAAASNQKAYIDAVNYNGCWTQCFLNEAWLGCNLGSSGNIGYDGDIKTDLNFIFSDGKKAYTDHLFTSHTLYYSSYQTPWIWSHGSDFYLSNYGIYLP